MTEIDTAPAGMTVRDLYAIVIRVISLLYIIAYLTTMPVIVLGYALYAGDYAAAGIHGARNPYIIEVYGNGMILLMAVIFFVFTPQIVRFLERDPDRPVPVFTKWPAAFVAEVILLVIGLMYLVVSVVALLPLLLPPQAEFGSGGIQFHHWVSILQVALSIALVYFRVPIAHFLVNSFRFGAPKNASDAPPSDGQ